MSKNINELEEDNRKLKASLEFVKKFASQCLKEGSDIRSMVGETKGLKFLSDYAEEVLNS